MDYSSYLVLYSGGADSTFFVQREPTAKHLIHYAGLNPEQTRVAAVNANLLDRYLTIEHVDPDNQRDGETNQIHALYDTKMALDAAIRAISHGMKGIVMCFNADDLGIDFESITAIVRRAEQNFELLLPLRNQHAKSIRQKLKALKGDAKLKYVSCMYGTDCGFCAKCKRGH
jgi:hypothetical protein